MSSRSFNDLVVTADGAVAGFHPVFFEELTWKMEWLCEKWSEDVCEFVRRRLGLDSGVGVGSDLIRKFARQTPEDEIFVQSNMLLNEGIQLMEDLLIGAGGTTFANANAQMGVGDSTTAEAPTQTDLQAATNKTWKAVNAGSPTRSSQTLTFIADFLTSDANYAWQEMSIRNGAAADKNLNRKQTSLGTKATGTWTLTGTVAIS